MNNEDTNNSFIPTSYNTLLQTKQLTWSGRRLIGVGNDITYEYDGLGMRVSKITPNETTTYLYEGKNLIHMEKVSSETTYKLDFVYDASGLLIGLNTIEGNYFYRRDILGNIIGLIDINGNYIVRYVYDAWGNFDKTVNISCIASLHNPFVYKGYYYDEETGFYYLKSRYYSPEIKRFINIDDFDYIEPESLNGINLFAYCGNNPVMYQDPEGNSVILACILGVIAFVGLGLTIGGVASENNIVTAVGLTMVAVPAIVSGGIAIAAGVGGAILTGIVGGVTVGAGIGSSLFASAEYQETFTGNNWMIDAGMSEEMYNGLMITTAVIATAGTFASSFCSSFKIKSIKKIGKIDEYNGILFENSKEKERVLSFHTHGHKIKSGWRSIPEWHWQLKKWDSIAGKTAGTIARWIWWLLTKHK